MNKIIKMLFALLCIAWSHQARSDGETLTGRYWFDQSTNTTAFTPGKLDVSTSGLVDGVHTFNAYVEKDGIVSSVHTGWFYKNVVLETAEEAVLHISVDGNERQSLPYTHADKEANLNLDMTDLCEGIHCLDVFVDVKGSLSSAHSHWFVKTFVPTPGETYTVSLFIDGRTWQTIETLAGVDGILSLNLDVNELPLGLHTLQAQVVSANGVASDTRYTMFMRVLNQTELADLRAYYLIDNSIRGDVATTVNGDVFKLDIDASSLVPGLHSVSVYMAGAEGITTSVQTGWFIKTPLGGDGVKQYEYWLNDNYTNIKSVVLDKPINPFDFVSLIEVEPEPFRSSQYTFAIENETPMVYAQNDFQIRFQDSEGRVSMSSKPYTDVRVKQQVNNIIDVENAEMIPVGPLSENDMQWLRFEAEAGDSLSVRLERGAMYEVWSPTATKVFAARGAEAVSPKGSTLTENGTYYIAVHDIATSGSGGLKAYIQHIPRFAILGSTPERTAATDFMVMQLNGNGFDQLVGLTIKNKQNSFEIDSISVSDRYNLSAFVDFDVMKIPQGKYDVEGVFNDDGKVVKYTLANALQIVEAGKAQVRTEVVAPRIIGTPYQIHVNVVNDSEQPCWGVPVNIAVADTHDGISLELTDFIPIDGESEESVAPEYFYTDNLLGTGQSGVMIPLCIPYIGPRETITLNMGLYSGPHDHVPVYAWNGQPWSEEFKEIFSEDFDIAEIVNLEETNLVSARELVCYSLIEELGENSVSEPSSTARKSRTVVVNGASTSMVRNVALYAHDLAMKEMGKIAYQRQVAKSQPMRMLNPSQWDIQSDVNRLLRQFPTLKKVKIKIVRKGGSGGSSASSASASTKPTNPTPTPSPTSVDCYQSGDPNDMQGYVSPSGDNFIGIDIKNVEYTIEFENDPEIANAPASLIKVTNTLNKNCFDLTSFKPLKLKIGEKETELPDKDHFTVTMDMRPEIGSVAELTFDYDPEEGTAAWTLRSLDPMTMDAVKYMDDGILPINDDTGRGIGYLTYSIDLLPTLSDGAKIENMATIIFDDNSPIDTPTYENLTDYVRPEAKITEYTTDDGHTFYFSIEGSDSGSGIWMYNLYASKAGAGKWIAVKTGITDDHFVLDSEDNLMDASFAITAIDRAGNSQQNPFGDDDDFTDAIDCIEVDAELLEYDECYDLQGRKVDPYNSHGVIVVCKGQKFLIR